MTFAEFDKYTEEILGKVRKMRDSKGIEYTGAGSNVEVADRFANFNRSAEKIKITRMQAWFILFDKHYHSLVSYINNEREFSDEGIEGRIVDMLTYLILAGGMIKEDKALQAASISRLSNDYSSKSPADEGYWNCRPCFIWIRPDQEHCPKCGNKRPIPEKVRKTVWKCYQCWSTRCSDTWNDCLFEQCGQCGEGTKAGSAALWLSLWKDHGSTLKLCICGASTADSACHACGREMPISASRKV